MDGWSHETLAITERFVIYIYIYIYIYRERERGREGEGERERGERERGREGGRVCVCVSWSHDSVIRSEGPILFRPANSDDSDDSDDSTKAAHALVRARRREPTGDPAVTGAALFC